MGTHVDPTDPWGPIGIYGVPLGTPWGPWGSMGAHGFSMGIHGGPMGIHGDTRGLLGTHRDPMWPWTTWEPVGIHGKPQGEPWGIIVGTRESTWGGAWDPFGPIGSMGTPWE